jgi:hypothetical protein
MFGRRVNFDVPGHVRRGYHIDEFTVKLRRAGLELLDIRATYGMLETFTNNISYLITGADRRNKHLYALVFPALLVISYFGKFAQPVWGAGVLATARRPNAEGPSHAMIESGP